MEMMVDVICAAGAWQREADDACGGDAGIAIGEEIDENLLQAGGEA